RSFHFAPRAAGLLKLGILARLAFFSDGLADALQLLRHLLVRADDFVECVSNFSGEACPRAREANGKVAVAHGLQGAENQREVSVAATVTVNFWGRLNFSCGLQGRGRAFGSAHALISKECQTC